MGTGRAQAGQRHLIKNQGVSQVRGSWRYVPGPVAEDNGGMFKGQEKARLPGGGSKEATGEAGEDTESHTGI